MPRRLEIEKLIANDPSVDRMQMDEIRLAIKRWPVSGLIAP